MARLSNPVEFMAEYGSPEAGLALGQTASRPTATQATERAKRLVKRAAVAAFGRGKTELVYRHGYWIVHVYGPKDRFAGSFVAIDRQPGVAGTGIALLPAR